ncbi:MAG: (d)CMP kinase [Calditrichota bacterium]
MYIDTGAMYRAVTLKALEEEISVRDINKVAQLAEKVKIEFGKNNQKTIIYLDGKDVSDDIRAPRIDQQISPVAANPEVRKVMVKKQQEMGRHGGVILDGRDIGTVVFPKAELKIYMLASVEVRALRRKREMEQKGLEIDLDKIENDIRYRDRQDMGRSHGPLKKAEDALEIDTTRLTIEQQVDLILKLAKEKITGS